jgi:hypothetical protein
MRAATNHAALLYFTPVAYTLMPVAIFSDGIMMSLHPATRVLALLFLLSLGQHVHPDDRSSSAVPSTSTPPPASAPSAARLHSRLIQNGFVRLPSILSREEALSWRSEILDAGAREASKCATVCKGAAGVDLTDPVCAACDASTKKEEGDGGEGGDTSTKSFVRARQLEEYAPRARSLIRSRHLAEVVAGAMNATRLRLYQASLFWKRAGDAPSAWHQDSAATPLHTDKFATLWIALDDLPADAGALRFLRGSHLPDVPAPSLRNLPLAARLQTMKLWEDGEIVSSTGLSIVEAQSMSAGDATLHLGWTLHGSLPNTSERDRPALAISYFVDGARVHPDLLRMEGAGEGPGAPKPGEDNTRAVRLSTADGQTLVVRLLADDASTWTKWLQARPPMLIPGSVVDNKDLTPVVFDAAWTGKEGVGADGSGGRKAKGKGRDKVEL